MTFNCLIMGAAGRDFHDFQTFFRRHAEFRVRAFTAAQIPDIECRSFPQSLAGRDYTADIPIHDASPARLDRVVQTTIPMARVRYHFQQVSGMPILDLVQRVLLKGSGTKK